MRDHRLPQSAKNDVFKLVQATGLSPNDFVWSEVAASRRDFVYSRITHRPTGYSFSFAASSAMGDVYLSGKWTPADAYGQTSQQAESREEQMIICSRWLAVVKGEAETPDLWAAFKRAPDILVAEVVEDGGQRFADAERRQLLRALDEIKGHLIRSIGPSPAQATQINITFQHMAESSERMTKRDWKTLFVGGLVSLLVTLGTNQSVIESTLQLAANYILPLLTGQLPAGP
jgi:hypothetical protein